MPKYFIKAVAGVLVLSSILVACGGGSTTVVPESSSSSVSSSVSSSSASSVSSSVASSSASSVSSSSASSVSSSASSSSSSVSVVTKTWGFDSAAYQAAGTTLFSAAYSATADNNIAITAGDVKVDGLIFNSSAASVLRYRPTAASGNGSGSDWWNTNGSFYTSNAIMLPAVGADIASTGGAVRTYMAVPVTAGKAFTISLKFTQTSTLAATVGKLALVGSDGKVLAVANAGNGGFPAAVSGGMGYAAGDGHALTHVKVFYSRENDTSKAGQASGGVNITQLVREQ